MKKTSAVVPNAVISMASSTMQAATASNVELARPAGGGGRGVRGAMAIQRRTTTAPSAAVVAGGRRNKTPPRTPPRDSSPRRNKTPPRTPPPDEDPPPRRTDGRSPRPREDGGSAPVSRRSSDAYSGEPASTEAADPRDEGTVRGDPDVEKLAPP